MVLAAGLSGVAGVVSAQENPTGTIPTEEETETSETNETYAVAVDPVTRVVEWEYSEGRFVILVEADVPQLLTVSESPDVSEGVGTFNVKRISLPRGRRRRDYDNEPVCGSGLVPVPIDRRAVGSVAVRAD
jgi:hypothetical protein